jgi:hypothetical protein
MEILFTLVLFPFVTVALLCGLIAAIIAHGKHRDVGGWFLLGAIFPPFILAVGFLPPLASAEWAESVKRPAPRALGPFLVAVFIGLILLAALLSQRQPSKPAPTRVIAPPSVDETIPHAAEGPAPLGTFTMPAALRRATQDLPASIRVSGFVCHHISSGRQIGRTERGTVVRILCDFDTRPYRVLVTPQNRLVIRPWSE